MSPYEPSAADVAASSLLVRAILGPYYARRIRSLGLSGAERVLDFGSGPGVAALHIARRLAEGGGRLTCVDVSRNWLRAAQRITRRYPNVEHRVGDIAALDIEDGVYDVVFIHFVLHDIPAQQRPDTMRHLAAKLRGGGRLSLREPTGKGHGISPQEVGRLMAGAGLQQAFIETRRVLWIQPVCAGLYLKPS